MIKHLEWDSNFFGFKTGKLVKPITATTLQNELYEASNMSYKLLYLIQTASDNETKKLALLHGGALVDEKTTFEIELNTKQIYNYSPHVEAYTQVHPSPALRKLAIEAGIYSRFKLDTNFAPDTFERMYNIWIERSTNRQIADDVLVALIDNQIAGMITLSSRDNVGNIGLISVDNRYRGQNIGTQLIEASKAYFSKKNINKIQVVTQKANTVACRFYEKCGFYEYSVENVFHFWL